jgi:homoserine kinase type II
MPLPSAVHEPCLRADSVRRLAVAHRLGTVKGYVPLTAGYLNCNYRVETDAGQYFVKRHIRIRRSDLKLQHQLLMTLQERGLPVGAPLRDQRGNSWTVVNHRPVAVFPWTVGEHRSGASLTKHECVALGELLGRTHQLLGEIGGDHPQPFLLPQIPIQQALKDARRLLHLARAHRPQDDFDQLATGYLSFTIEQLGAYRDASATQVSLTPWQLTHGDFHQWNVIFGSDGRMTVVDWDRVRVQPRLSELVRTLVLWLHDPDTGAIDVERACWIVQGYTAQVPVERGALAQMVEHYWWSKLTDLWIPQRHYERDDTVADELLARTLGWFRWLSRHREAFGQALEKPAG